jgi:FSR family fosmidomycin resistance protein-like MFS transporter
MGAIADTTGIEHVYRVASFLPLLGVLAVFLPRMDAARRR